MRHSLLLLLFGYSLTLCAQSVDSLIDQQALRFPKGTYIAIAVLNHDSVTYYGYTKADSSYQAADHHQVLFEIGSITKIMTSHLLAQAVQEGTVKLDKPIRNYLRYQLKGNAKITLLQLSNHTAGLPRLPDNFVPLMQEAPDNPYLLYTEALLKTYLTKEMTLEYRPGKGTAYSNLGAGVLGHALSKVWQQPYADLLQARIFAPLGMTHTYASAKQAPSDASWAPPQNALGQPTPHWDWDVLAPAGSVVSCITDMSHYAQAHFQTQDPIVQLMQQQTYKIDEKLALGLGWLLVQSDRGKRLLFHNGATGGYTSSIALQPADKKGVVVLTNLSGFHPERAVVDQIALLLMKQLLD